MSRYKGEQGAPASGASHGPAYTLGIRAGEDTFLSLAPSLWAGARPAFDAETLSNYLKVNLSRGSAGGRRLAGVSASGRLVSSFCPNDTRWQGAKALGTAVGDRAAGVGVRVTTQRGRTREPRGAQRALWP